MQVVSSRTPFNSSENPAPPINESVTKQITVWPLKRQTHQFNYNLEEIALKDFQDYNDKFQPYKKHTKKITLVFVPPVLPLHHASDASFNYGSLPQVCRQLCASCHISVQSSAECCHLGHPAVLRSIVISTKVKMLPPRIFSMHTLICRARPNESSVTSTFQKAHLRPQQQGDIESREARQRRSCPPPTVVRFSLLPLKRSEWKADPLYISQVGSLSSTCLPLLVFKVAFLFLSLSDLM